MTGLTEASFACSSFIVKAAELLSVASSANKTSKMLQRYFSLTCKKSGIFDRRRVPLYGFVSRISGMECVQHGNNCVPKCENLTTRFIIRMNCWIVSGPSLIILQAKAFFWRAWTSRNRNLSQDFRLEKHPLSAYLGWSVCSIQVPDIF